MRPRLERRTWLASVAALLILLLSCVCIPCAGMIDDDVSLSCSSDDTFFAAWSFEFAEGGEYTLVALNLLPSDSWQQRNATVQVILATDTQLDPIRSASMDSVCSGGDSEPFSFAPVTWSVRLGAEQTSARYAIRSVPTKDWYRLLVLNCDGDDFTMHFSSIAVNPGGEYLSLSQVPYKKLFLSFVWIWLALLCAWLAHVWLYRAFNVSIQVVLALLPLSKGCLCIPNELYWNHASSTGYFSLPLGWAVLLTETGERVLWFLVLFLLASGWRLTKHELHPLEFRALVVLLGILSLSFFAWSYVGGFTIFLLLVAYVLMLRLIFAGVVDSGNRLLRQLSVLHEADIDPAHTPLQEKLRMFKQLQVSLLCFISIDVLFQLWSSIFLKNSPWISDAAEHSLEALLFLGLAWTFRMRPFNPFYLRIVAAMIEGAPEEAVPLGAAAAGEAEGNDEAPRGEGQPPPRGSRSSSRRSGAAASSRAGGDEYQALPEAISPTSSSIALHSVAAAMPSGDDTERTALTRRAPYGGDSASGGCCQWRSVGPDRLWRPFCPVPDLDQCEPSVGALEAWGAGELAAGRRAAAQASASAADKSLPPILILENGPSDPQPAMIGTLIVPAPSASTRALESGSDASWASLPPAALPYLPRDVREQLERQERALQEDSRALGGGSRPQSRRASASASRPSRRHDDFPEYI